MPDKQSNTLLSWICIAAITVITYFAFSPSLKDGITNWDDSDYVTNNALVVKNKLPLVKIFETPVSDNYHPITILSLALNYRYGKLNTFGYHLVNLIFHLLNTILVFLFVFLLTRRNLMMAAIVSLFFGIHPMHVESVTWISERKDVLYVFFFVAGLITYLRYRETKKNVWYLFTFLLFILSCLSKGMAVVFPVILLLIDYLKEVRWERRLFVEKIPFFLLSIVFGIIAVKIQQNGQAFNAMKTYTIFQRLIFASYGAVMYIVKLFVPYKLSAYYLYPDIRNHNGIPLIFYLPSFILLLITGALVYFFRKKEKEIVFGLLFYFVSVALVLQFITVGLAIMADRYSYLSYIGLLFVAAYIINKVWESKSGILMLLKYPFIIIVVAGAVLFSLQTYSRTQAWKNSDVLWTDVINKYPDAYMAYYNRGLLYVDEGKYDSAIADFSETIKYDSSYVNAYYSLGLIYSKYNNKQDLAMAYYTKAIAIDPACAAAYLNRALLYDNYGKGDSAMNDLSEAIKIDPRLAEAYTNRGIGYYNYGKKDLALADFKKAITLDSTVADAYSDRGTLYLNNGETDLALADLNKAIAHDSSSAICYYNRGLCYEALHQYEKAIADFSKAIELNSSVYYFWLNRSIAESKIGQSEMAKADAIKARQLQGK
jgi:protein O-mannosyl-transferase